MSKHFVVVFWLGTLLMTLALLRLEAQPREEGSTRPGKYTNPIIHADYSDPDVIAVGNDFYMTASSFNAVPGLPILHSKDLVHWSLIGYALQELIPADSFVAPQHGKGVWAPSIRFHKGMFYIFYPDPDFGIYVIKSKSITGPWTAPLLVESGKGLIDPCPLWDDNGKLYLVHAFAGSRAGFKSVLVMKELNPEASRVTGNAVLVYDGHGIDATVEGPKLHKRNGYYYLFAPAGGVATGWQLVLRSKNIYGPYERKVVLHQGNTSINGPHQGAWVHTAANEDWFIHFQDKQAYGRVVHLQPVQWKNDWPVIGMDSNSDGIGEPVDQYRLPIVPGHNPVPVLPASDQFESVVIGRQWQWHTNPQAYWAFPSPATGTLRLNAVLMPVSAKNWWDIPNLLLQKFPAEQFSVVTKLSFSGNTTGESIQFGVMGLNYASIGLTKKADGIYITYHHCLEAEKGTAAIEQTLAQHAAKDIYLSIAVRQGAVCTFGYSLNGIDFKTLDEPFIATPGKWIGAKFGFACTRKLATNDAGFADIDWVEVKKIN